MPIRIVWPWHDHAVEDSLYHEHEVLGGGELW